MKYVLAALAASFALATPAFAQDWDRHHDRGERHRDHDRDYRRGDRDREWDRHDRRDRWERRQERRQWRRGERFEGRDCDNYRRVDYRRHHLRQPPRGMYYVMDDRGDIMLVIARSNIVIAVNIR